MTQTICHLLRAGLLTFALAATANGTSPLAVSTANAEPPLAISNAWLRALPAGLPAGGYFTLHNTTAKPIVLSGASSSACGMIMLHKSEAMSGMAHMSDVETVSIPSGGKVEFAPGGYHLMCMNPAPAIKPGGQVGVTLEFADGTRLEAKFSVRGANGE